MILVTVQLSTNMHTSVNNMVPSQHSLIFCHFCAGINVCLHVPSELNNCDADALKQRGEILLVAKL